MHKTEFHLTLALLVFSAASFAQPDLKTWYQKDPVKDSFYGISLQKTYGFLKNKKSAAVIVAVIDGGIDTNHEDLKNILWHNPNEIPGNGIDDDNNGYIDDIHGWNFLGNSNGNNLEKANSEKARTYYRFKEKFADKNTDTASLTPDEKWQYMQWARAASQMEVNPDDQMQVMMLDAALKSLKKHNELLRTELGKEEYTSSDVEAYQPSGSKARQAKMAYLTFLKILNIEEDATNTEILDELEGYVDGKKLSIEAASKKPEDYRTEIVKDDYYNINDKFYGNADVMGPDPMHGTHVSGLIAAQRDNGVGINGVADNVQIMMLRAVPDGDEYDKDVALAIKYAVDNGAKIINMSFGKSFSPEKKWVDEAVQYAAAHDVLLVHAAGNDSKNVDSAANYPNPFFLSQKIRAPNYITVGAGGYRYTTTSGIVADFSNYGSNAVDIFAPGVKMYSTLPGGDEYGFLQGTSMAAPVVSGVAALIRSYFPKLSAEQVKFAIEKSIQPLPDSVLVNLPGSAEKVPMNELCRTAGFLNADAAIELAATLKQEPLIYEKDKNGKPVLLRPKEGKVN